MIQNICTGLKLEYFQILFFLLINTFKINVYILKVINHSVWFGIKINHTNTIESLLHNIKKIYKYFFGLSRDFLKKKFNNVKDLMTDYFCKWFCYSLLIFYFKRKKLNWPDGINDLSIEGKS